MRNVVVTEGESDSALLKAILDSAGIRGVEFIPAGGWSSADSLARSILIHGASRVALVLDSETTNHNRTEERKRFLKRSLAEVDVRSQGRVFVFEPEAEILFFDNPPVLKALVGKDVSDTDLVAGQFEPKKTLARLVDRKSLLSLYEGVLPQIDLEPLRHHPTVQQLQHFLDMAGRKAAA